MPRPLSLQLYRGLMTALLPVLPYYLGRRAKAGKEDSSRLDERFGKGYDAPVKLGKKTGAVIWLHGVSVGEVSAALALARALLTLDEDAHFIITTGTSTAAAMTQKAGADLPLTHCYAPFDAPASVARFLAHYQPDFGVIFESDFWPTIMTSTHEAGIPLYLASAQMSDDSAKRWQKFPQLAHALFGPVAACFAHDEVQSAHFASLGIANTQTTGSLKLPNPAVKKTTFAKELIKAGDGRLILLGASTHAGEEAQILAISEHLRAQNIDHLLIIAPRHPDRGDTVASLMVDAKRRSHGAMPSPDDRLYLCDSLGDMASLYQAADIVWLGATFSGKGGHNPLEAASYGKPVICGPSQFKNQFEFDQLFERDVCHQISDASQSAHFIAALYADDERRKAIAKAGKAYAKKAAKRPLIVAKHILNDIKKRGQ